MSAQTGRTNTLLLAVLLVFLTSCAPKTTVVLLPDPDGNVGQITVITDVGSVDISQAGEASTISDRDSLPTSPKRLTKNELEAEFSEVLTILPIQPVHFILYFKQDSTRLTSDSIKTLPEIINSIQHINSKDISVIGHSDTAGNTAYNLQLSRKRADAVSRLLVTQGINKNQLKSTSHGEVNPLIKTADNVNEPRNRRVEVVIR